MIGRSNGHKGIKFQLPIPNAVFAHKRHLDFRSYHFSRTNIWWKLKSWDFCCWWIFQAKWFLIKPIGSMGRTSKLTKCRQIYHTLSIWAYFLVEKKWTLTSPHWVWQHPPCNQNLAGKIRKAFVGKQRLPNPNYRGHYTLDGSFKVLRLHQLRLVVEIAFFYRVLFYIPGGCLGFLNHQQYDTNPNFMHFWRNYSKITSHI